jgi:putative transposase
LKKRWPKIYKPATASSPPPDAGSLGGYYQRNLLTPVGKIERLEVPRDREGEFVTELFERYKRMTGDVEETVVEMYLSGISGKGR